MAIGEQIKAARKKAGLTQAQLAEKSGVAAISIHQYEAGKREPRLEQLLRLAPALNVSMPYLLEVEDADGNMLPTYFADSDDFEFIKMLGLNTPSGRQTFFSDCPGDDDPASRIKRAWTKLNEAGKEKAAERIEELAEISRYVQTPEE